jgi:hypothetical protein
MSAKNLKIHEANGQITFIELKTLINCLPVKDETYSRILFGLMMKGLIKLPAGRK